MNFLIGFIVFLSKESTIKIFKVLHGDCLTASTEFSKSGKQLNAFPTKNRILLYGRIKFFNFLFSSYRNK